MTAIDDPAYRDTLKTFETLQPGAIVELKHEIKVGFRTWETTTVGRVVEASRRRHGLHFQRNTDDKAFSDIIVLQRDDGELTTVTLDEYSRLRVLSS